MVIRIICRSYAGTEAGNVVEPQRRVLFNPGTVENIRGLTLIIVKPVLP